MNSLKNASPGPRSHENDKGKHLSQDDTPQGTASHRLGHMSSRHQRRPTINDRLQERRQRVQADAEILTGRNYKHARLRQRLWLCTWPMGIARLCIMSILAAVCLVYSAYAGLSASPGQSPKQVAGSVCLLAFSLLLWRHMEVHTLVVVRKTRLVHLTRWHAQGMWVGRDTQQVSLEQVERLTVQELKGDTPEDGTIFRMCLHLEGGLQVYGLETDCREVALEQIRRLRRFMQTLLVLCPPAKASEGWLMRKVRTLQRMDLHATHDSHTAPLQALKTQATPLAGTDVGHTADRDADR